MGTFKRQSYSSKFLRWLFWVALYVLIATVSSSLAQQTAGEKDDLEDLLLPGTEVFDLRYAHPNEVWSLFQAFELRPTSFKSHKSKIYARFQDPAEAKRARKLLQKLDVPPRQIQVDFKQVLASNLTYYKQSSIGQRKFVQPVPDQKLLDQLKQVFKFEHYHLIGESNLIVNAGAKGELQLGTDQALCLTSDSPVSIYVRENNVAFDVNHIDEGKGIIQLRTLKVWTVESGVLTTSLNIKNGDTVIVGSSAIDGTDTALIFIVKARTVD